MNRNAAPNGALMRTSILGCYQYDDLEKVIANTINIAKVGVGYLLLGKMG